MASVVWQSLHKHLLDSVLERLESPKDYLHFSIVCKWWYSVAKDNYNPRAKVTTPVLLLIQTAKRGTWSLCDVMQNKVLDFHVQVPNVRFCGSSKGWLIYVDKDSVVTLVNPFFRVKRTRKKENSIIRLPPLISGVPPLKNWDSSISYYFAYKAILSADPVLCADNYIVVVICEVYCQLAFIRPGKDTTWTFVADSRHIIEDVVPVEDEFYGVDQGRRNLVAFDTSAQYKCNVILDVGNTEEAPAKRYLVDLNEKRFLMVERYGNVIDGRRMTYQFRIFEMKSHKCEWTEIYDLGDVALFVGDNSSIALAASKYSGCQPNCIYFYHDNISQGAFQPMKSHDFGVYNVKDQSFSQPYPEDIMTLMQLTSRPPIWVERPFKL
ncbi:F-box protein [Pyrus ussuriensis x Pyrus communis]|uniref:F-box protein n=1 Tax=Pyrus ussuriensis x Pyrus communis TaxID=2448454 RepID=A0A5N5F0K2_9ROSA|nr:F-box protein [Pyrus ussuriensis x Pyrus communis]